MIYLFVCDGCGETREYSDREIMQLVSHAYCPGGLGWWERHDFDNRDSVVTFFAKMTSDADQRHGEYLDYIQRLAEGQLAKIEAEEKANHDATL